jgi:hypothetical protein
VTATARRHRKRNKKADVAEHPEVFDHVGLLVNEPPGQAGLPFTESSDNFDSNFIGAECESTRGP